MLNAPKLRNSYNDYDKNLTYQRVNRSCSNFQRGIPLTSQKNFIKSPVFDGVSTIPRNFPVSGRRYSPLKEIPMNTISNLKSSRVIPTNMKSPIIQNYTRISPPRVSPQRECSPGTQRYLAESMKNAENFKNLYLQTLNEVGYWKCKFDDLQKQNLSFSNKNQEIISLEQELTTMREVLDLRNREIQEWKRKFDSSSSSKFESEISRYQEALLLLASENERLHNVAKNYIDELNALSQNMEELAYEKDNMGLHLKSKESLELQMEELKSRVREREAEIIELRGQVSRQREIEENAQITMREISQLRERMHERDIEVSKFQFLQSELNSNKSLLEKTKSENLTLNSKLVQITSALENVNYELKIKSEELDRFRIKGSQIDLNEREVMNLRGENERLESKCQSLGQQINSQQTEISRLNQALSSLRSENLSFQEISYKLQSLASERDSLRSELTIKGEELDGWKSRVAVLEGKFRESESLKHELNKLMEVVSFKEKEISSLSQDLEEASSRLFQMENSEFKLQEQSRKMERLVSEIERLRGFQQQVLILQEQLVELENCQRDVSSLKAELHQADSLNQRLSLENQDFHLMVSSLREQEKIKDINIDNLNEQLARLISQKEGESSLKERVLSFLMIFVVQAAEIESLRNLVETFRGKEIYKHVRFSPNS